MSDKEFKKGTEFELHKEIYIVTSVTDDGKWIMYDYKDGRKTTIQEKGHLQFMPMSDNWSNANVLCEHHI